MFSVEMPRELLLYLTYIPLLITIVAVVRYIIGIKTFGIYAPIVLSFAYYSLDPTNTGIVGLKYGIVVTLSMIFFATLFHQIISKMRMHYLTKMAIVYTGVVLGLITTLILFSSVYPERIVRFSPLPILMIITITDRFIAYQIKKNIWVSVVLTVESILVGVIGYFLLKWEFLRDLMINNPSILIVVLIFNLILGRYTGLRLWEYFRFTTLAEEELEEE